MSDVTRFQAPRPKFQAPTNAHAVEAMTPQVKDTTPAPSVVERTAADGNDKLASLLASSQAAAKASAKAIEAQKAPRATRTTAIAKSPTSETPTPKVVAPKFKPEDVVDDATFIRRTRDNTHSPEVQALFWANGGERHLVGGLSYAQALDNLRREKLQRLKQQGKPVAAPYSRHGALPQGRVITPGMPTPEDRVRTHRAQEHAKRVVTNERWAGFRK